MNTSPSASPKKKATVAICTHNRCDSLSVTLEALVNQQTPDFTFEVLVVDNASTDRTREVVLGFRNARVSVQYIYVQELGVSHARNRAIDSVTTPFLVMLDDDTVPEPYWLHTLLATFDTIQPMPGAVGGRVHLQWTTKQPDWMPDELLGVYSWLDYGNTVRPVKMVFTCNVAFPRSVIERYRFDTRLGVTGSEQVAGEDADLVKRM